MTASEFHDRGVSFAGPHRASRAFKDVMTDITEDKAAPPQPPPARGVEDRAFLWLVVAVSLAFGWILWPFHGAVLWAIVFAILFMPLCRRLTRSMTDRRTLAAVVTVLIVVLLVILPLALITASLVREATGVYERMQSGGLSFGRFFQQVLEALPPWATSLLDRFGLTNFGDVLERFSSGLLQGSQFIAARAISIGQNTAEFLINLFLMLYLLFFLLRDGEALVRRIRDALPLREAQKRPLFTKFAIVIRATVKGNIVVAIVQGALGGLIFWVLGLHAPLLWGVLMAFLSLLPAVGAAVVWLPVAIYLLATGNLWDGLILIGFGAFVIGLVDNVLRPILVGGDTKMPDYVVLISTLGGIAVFGLNGFVIGPVIAAMFIACWDLFAAERSERP
jgi:predicted PurR-regulated permease PerM